MLGWENLTPAFILTEKYFSRLSLVNRKNLLSTNPFL